MRTHQKHKDKKCGVLRGQERPLLVGRERAPLQRRHSQKHFLGRGDVTEAVPRAKRTCQQ